MNANQLMHTIVAAFAAMSLIGTASAEASPLPADYVPLEWIRSTTGAEYIDTHYVLEAGNVIETEVNLSGTQPTKYTLLFGCNAPGWRSHVFQPNFGSTTATKPTYKFGGKDAVGNQNAFPVEERVTVSCQGETAKWWKSSEGVEKALTLTCQGAPASETYASTLFIFNQNKAIVAGEATPETGCQTKMRLYSFKILDSDGETVLRNFVPCRRKADGVLGVYETEEQQEFYPNASTSGRFSGSDESLRYSYVQLTSSQYLDTGYLYQPSTTVETILYVPQTETSKNKYQVIFGAHAGEEANSMAFMPWNTWKSNTKVDAAFYCRDALACGYDQGSPFIYGAWLKLVCDAEGASWVKLDGTGEKRVVTTGKTGPRTTGRYTLLVNALHEWDRAVAYGFNGIRFRSFTISEETGLKRNYLPMRLDDGSVGLYDSVSGKRVMTSGTCGGVLHTVSADGATIQVHEGVFTSDDILGYSSVEKKGQSNLNASAVTSYPSLSLCEGSLSFQDDATKSYEVEGTLKLVGGTTLAVDWVGTACDSFSASVVDLSEATEGNPVMVVVDASKATFDMNQPVTLLSSNVAEGDEKKFAVLGVDVKFEVQDGKLLMRYADLTVPVRAVWTGKGERGKMADTNNWVCYNCFDIVMPEALPTVETFVTIPADLAGSFDCPRGETLEYRHFEIPSFVTLTQDCDWSGLDEPISSTIDLVGYSLTVSDLRGTGTITDSTEGGELHLDVPQGSEVRNESVALTGSLTLVKDGGGTFVPEKRNQTYKGGTELLDGTVKAGGLGTDYRWGASGSTITVGTNSVFELQAQTRFADYTFVLNGGTLKNSTAISGTYYWQMNGIKNIRVDSDSTLDFAKAYSVMSYANSKYDATTIDLRGHVLTVNFGADYCYFSSVTATRGTMVLKGRIQFIGDAFQGKETTFDVEGWIAPETDIHIGTYICRTTTASPWTSKDVYVYERFKPVTDKFWGCVLKDGTTLDLSTRGEAWNVKGTLTGTSKTTVTFEDNATVLVDLGERSVKSGERVVAWDEDTKPTNLDTLKFKLSSGQAGALLKKDNGVYFQRGMVILLY